MGVGSGLYMYDAEHVSGAERSGPICRSVAQALSVASRSTLRSTLRPFFKGRSPLRSATSNFLSASPRSDANARIMTELTTDVKFHEILSS